MGAYSKISDVELTTLLSSGDRLAYTEIFNRYNGLLYLHAFKKFRNREEAKDIVQEVFAMIWTKREEMTPKSNLSGYLYTCMHHKILDWFGHQKIEARYVQHLQVLMEENKGTTDNLVRERQLFEIVQREIAALPPKMRQVFEMSRYQHLSHKEIAATLNISEETVKSHVKNALKILRVKLGLSVMLVFLLNL